MKAPVLLLIPVALLTGCAIFRPYDPLVANVVQTMTARTQEVVADGNAGKLSLKDSRDFLRQSRAQAQVLRGRARECRLSPDECTLLDDLDHQYAALLRCNRPLRDPAATRLKNTLLALQSGRPVLEFNYDPSGISTIDDSSIDTSASQTKNCDSKGGDHGDHGGHDCGCRGGGGGGGGGRH